MSDSPEVPNAIKEEHRPRRYRGWITGLAVVLVIGVLIAIALPTFLPSRHSSGSKVAPSNLRNALVAARTCFMDQMTYQPCGAPALVGIEPSGTYVDGSMSSHDPRTVSVAILDQSSASTGIGMAAWSKNGMCFYLQDIPEVGTTDGVAGDSAAGVLEKRLASLEKKRSKAQSQFVRAKALSNRATVAMGRMNTFLEKIAVIRSQLVVLEGVPPDVGATYYGVAEDSDGTDCFGKDALDRATETSW